ncbi:helix-turn-helix domain-containing protein [Luteococcus sp. Sow4_B9]|uniref:helix-turn-helix domain-containing protein n=1 Tax=Luteococcus sp. Sow4_B9 TaxID=3438792 RepID=UPI003F97BF15
MRDDETRDDFASKLNEAIKLRGLSLERIRHRLSELDVKVSVATLSYWQNGRSQPTRSHSHRTLTALEEVLEVEPGTLTSVAPVSQTRRRSGNGPVPLSLPSTVQEALVETGMTPDNLRKVSTHVTVMVATDRTQSSEVVRSVIQCLTPGTTSFPVLAERQQGSPQEPGEAQEVHALSNCSVGRRFVLENEQLTLTEMVLPRPLRQGELVMLEYMTAMPPVPEPFDSFGVAVSRLGELVVEIQFPRGDIPRRVVGYTRSVDEDLGFDSPDAVELPVSDGLVQAIKLDAPAGVYVVKWEW